VRNDLLRWNEGRLCRFGFTEDVWQNISDHSFTEDVWQLRWNEGGLWGFGFLVNLGIYSWCDWNDLLRWNEGRPYHERVDSLRRTIDTTHLACVRARYLLWNVELRSLWKDEKWVLVACFSLI
jgi:hypothetical protein